MAITGAIEIADLVPSDQTSKELKKLKSIIEKDNVSNLAKTQKNKFDEYAKKQNKTNLENPDNENAEKDLLDDNALDERVEKEFDSYLLKLGNDNAKGTLDKIKSGNMASIKNDFNAYLQDWLINKSQFGQYMKLLEDVEIKEKLKPFSFELETLSQEIMNSLATEGNEPGKNTSSDNVLLYNNDKNTTKPGENKEDNKKNKEKKEYDATKDYLDPYKQTSYTKVDNDMGIENIYKDTRVKKVLERIFENEKGDEIRKRMFNINLDKEDGLAGIIIAIRGAINSNTAGTPNELYTKLTEKNILSQEDATYKLNFSRSDLAELIDGGLLKYERKGGIVGGIDQRKKVANILSRAQRSDLDTFASLLQSKDDVTMAVKEWNNSLNMTGQNREKLEKGTGQTSLITNDNVLEFLCDFNSDGQISAEYKRKNNKEQKNQGDVGVLFGQQVMFTIEQAIKVKNVELGEPKGEQIIIQNIIKNMQIADYRSLNDIQKAPLIAMQEDLSKCTKENLAKLINGSPDEGILPMSEMKILFLDAIKKINGGSHELQPDLYDTLVDRDTEALLSLQTTEINLKAKLDEILTASQDPATKEMIRKNGLVRVRETCFIKIMTAIDNVEVTTNDGAKTQLQAAGVSKGRELHQLRNELLEKTITSLIVGGIHYSQTGGWRFDIGYGREGTSESGRTKRARGANGGVILGEGGKVGLEVNLSGEIAEQYNYKKVINANLSKVKSAKYVGIEGGALASISTSDRGVQAEGYAGINRQQDPVVGINQIDKQYRAVSEEIFDIEGASSTTLSDKEAFRTYIKNKIDNSNDNNVYGKFIENNRQHLTDNLDFMVRYMDTNNFFGENGICKKFPNVNKTTAINSLLDIIQSGNIESRRADVIAGLHGKVALTKLSFGVTTNALTLRAGGSGSSDTPPSSPPPTTGVDGSEPGIPQDKQEKEQDRFGIFGLYIGARISTWKNIYVPNEAQYLFTQYETGQGIGMEYLNNPAKDLDKYGKYLIALYNDPQNRLSYDVDNGRLILRFTGSKSESGSNLTLAKFLNIHATPEAQKGFSLRGNVLTIGNVSDMAAYTITEAKGVHRILCLGTKKLDEATRVTGDLGATNVDAMQFKETGKTIPRTQETLQTNIINTMTGTGPNVEIAKSTTSTFIDTEGKLIKPTDAVVTFDPKTIEGTKLTTGTLTIKKQTDGTYLVTLGTTPTDKLTIDYVDQNEYEKTILEAQNSESNRKIETGISSIDIKNSFKLPINLSNVFVEKTEKALSVFDNYYNKTLYKEFMESAVDTGLDPFIDATDYKIAFIKLKEILNKNIKYNQLTDLKILIESNLSINEKMLIVDKFKTIFSYTIELTDGKIDGKNLERKITHERGNIYKTMKGPNEEKYPLTIDYRKSIVNNLKNEPKLTREPVENLIGFTAFYKLGGKARKYAMTPIGGTNVLSAGNLDKAMLPINETDKTKAQEWFINNLNKNKDNKMMVLEKISSLLTKNNVNLSAKDLEDNLADFLTGKELIIQDFGIDSFKKISIDNNRVFYLLGECANESFGMQINGIKISTLNTTEAKYTASALPQKEYESNLNFKSHSIAARPLPQEKKVSIKFHHGRKEQQKEEIPPPPGPTDVDPIIPPPPGPTVIIN